MQLVLLDHGLYKQLPDDFRLDYAGLWRALILADEPEIRRHCVAMNAGGAVQLFTMMLTQRPWEQVWGDVWGRYGERSEVVCECSGRGVADLLARRLLGWSWGGRREQPG